MTVTDSTLPCATTGSSWWSTGCAADWTAVPETTAMPYSPLLYLHGLGDASPGGPRAARVLAVLVWALDFTGHGASTVPVGGGYSCELLMADADSRAGRAGPSTVYGRGLGGYVALLIAGARPDLVRGAIIDDGPGLTGGGVEPGRRSCSPSRSRADGPPDLQRCWAEPRHPPARLRHDVRRQAATLSGLDVAVAVRGRSSVVAGGRGAGARRPVHVGARGARPVRVGVGGRVAPQHQPSGRSTRQTPSATSVTSRPSSRRSRAWAVVAV